MITEQEFQDAANIIGCEVAAIKSVYEVEAAGRGYLDDGRVNAIAPGPFPTEGAWDNLLPEPIREKFNPKNKVPVGRVGEHQELANLVAYLLSDYSAYINGDCITIDGGEWLKGAGEFNNLEAVPKEMWDMLEMFIKSKK